MKYWFYRKEKKNLRRKKERKGKTKFQNTLKNERKRWEDKERKLDIGSTSIPDRS